MAEWLFDRGGRARILHDSDKLRNNQGQVIAWISENNVYCLRGRHVGWFEGGVVFDSRNCPIVARNRTIGLPSVPGIGGRRGCRDLQASRADRASAASPVGRAAVVGRNTMSKNILARSYWYQYGSPSFNQ
jgi:hypothetical protein